MYSVCYYIYRKREISSTEYVFNTEINYIVKSRILFKFIINHNNATQKKSLDLDTTYKIICFEIDRVAQQINHNKKL
jgi:hypothetical protein